MPGGVAARAGRSVRPRQRPGTGLFLCHPSASRETACQMSWRFGDAAGSMPVSINIARKTVREKKALQRTYSLKKNAQFKYVHRRGHSSGSHEMVLLYVRANTLKVGFSVGKKIGCAVKRNRVKRRLRAACVPLLPRMKPGLYIFIARQPAEKADFSKLCNSMRYTLRKQNLLKADEPAQQNPTQVNNKAGDAHD